jgi:DNA mismatch repair protein MutS
MASTVTAIYDDYARIYKKYKEVYGEQTAVFYQVGSFFELYDVLTNTSGITRCNVKDIVDILGIQLSTKSGEIHDLLFAGFPDYTLHRWAAKLTQLGWTVVVVEQKKDQNGKVEVREVTRVLSPGTHSESLHSVDAPYIASIWLEETTQTTTPAYGLSILDLSTGFSTSYEGSTRGKNAVWSADEAVHFFQIYTPREVIFHWRGDSFSQPNEPTIRRVFGLTQSTRSVHCRHALPEQQGFLEKSLQREEFLRKHFQPQTLLPIREYLHIQTSPRVERSICGLLQFIEDHFTITRGLQEHIPWSNTNALHCGNNALAQLNFLTEQNSDSILGIFQKCITPMGKRAVKRRLLSPLTQRASIEVRLQRTEWFHKNKDIHENVERSLRFMFDLPRIHQKFMSFRIQSGDILALYQTYKESTILYEFLQNQGTTLYEDITPQKASFIKLMDTWSALFSKEKAEQNEGSENTTFIQNGLYPELDECENKISSLYVRVQEWMDGICKIMNLSTDSLRIEEKEKSLFCVKGTKQVIQHCEKYFKAHAIDSAYTGIEFKVTKSVGHSIEAPFLEQAGHKLIGLRAQLASILATVIPKVCISFYEATGSLWQPIEEWIEELDMNLCFAKVAHERNYCKPTLTDNFDGSSLKIKHLRHPLIENLQNRSKYVTHNVNLGSASAERGTAAVEEGSIGWLLYGMNASGKSSLMKAIGIAVLLAQCGSYVPATEMSLAPFERLLTRILNVDNLWAGLSSFAVEISELRDIFMRADARTLVLGDELCSGTESVSATALVAAGIQFLAKKSSRFVFATHYHDLFKIPEIATLKGLAVWHLRVRHDPVADILIYDRTLSPGPGSTLYGIEVAKALNIPDEILEDAIRFRKTLQGASTTTTNTSSSWNSNISVRECELCGSQIKKDLEVHHIRPRMEASSETRSFSDGLARDSVRNLIVVCERCHDAHHNGTKPISPLTDTSVGPRRIMNLDNTEEIKPQKKVKLSAEELETVQKTISEFSHLTAKMLQFKLKSEFNISVTDTFIRKYKQ